MRLSRFSIPLVVLGTAALLGASGCVTTAKHPCRDGGQPAHDDGKVGPGTKQCLQVQDSTGKYVNHGKYVEWYPNGKRWLEGEYANGSKTGKWTEWDDQGRKIRDRWYEDGVEVPGREAKPSLCGASHMNSSERAPSCR